MRIFTATFEETKGRVLATVSFPLLLLVGHSFLRSDKGLLLHLPAVLLKCQALASVYSCL